MSKELDELRQYADPVLRSLEDLPTEDAARVCLMVMTELVARSAGGAATPAAVTEVANTVSAIATAWVYTLRVAAETRRAEAR